MLSHLLGAVAERCAQDTQHVGLAWTQPVPGAPGADVPWHFRAKHSCSRERKAVLCASHPSQLKQPLSWQSSYFIFHLCFILVCFSGVYSESTKVEQKTLSVAVDSHSQVFVMMNFLGGVGGRYTFYFRKQFSMIANYPFCKSIFPNSIRSPGLPTRLLSPRHMRPGVAPCLLSWISAHSFHRRVYSGGPEEWVLGRNPGFPTRLISLE